MVKLYVTFGHRYARETHPCDERAHPDGWFEFEGPTLGDVYRGIAAYLTPAGNRVPRYAFSYHHPDDLQPDYYPRGCLARFGVTDHGRVHDMGEVAR